MVWMTYRIADTFSNHKRGNRRQRNTGDSALLFPLVPVVVPFFLSDWLNAKDRGHEIVEA